MNKKPIKIVPIILHAAVWIIAGTLIALLVSGVLLPGLYDPANEGEAINRALKSVVIGLVAVLVILLSGYLAKLGPVFKKARGLMTACILIGNLLKYVAVIVGVILILQTCGIDTAAIITGTGVIALVIGLGCQSLIADVVAGMFILFEGDIQVGDIVVINGWRGEVEAIGIRTTKIVDAVGNVKIVNNSNISDIVNNTRELSVAVVDVGIEYNESIERVENILAEALPEMKKKLRAIEDGPFYKGVASLDDSAVTIRLVAKCKEEDKFQLERDLKREVKILFDENGVNIPFNQVVVNYREEAEAKPELSKKEKEAARVFNETQAEASKDIEEIKQ